MQKNEIVTLTVTDFNETGAGVGKTDGVPVFVSGAVIGDTVRARITAVKKSFAYARTEEILTPSEDRVEAPCPVFSKCGGCQLLSYDYPAQLAYKEKKVRDALVRIGKLPEETVDAVLLPIRGAKDPLRYRNKAQVPFADDVCGFYAVHSHRIVPVEDCLICPAEFKNLLRAVKECMRIADVDAYDEAAHTGYVRHVLLRKAFATGQIMVCVIVNGEEALSRFRDVLILHLTENASVTSICFNYHTGRDNVILGTHTECVYGKPYIEDILCDLRFGISARSFYQVNPVMCETLYETATDDALAPFADGKTARVVWDLYCGIGTITLLLAKKMREAGIRDGRVTGVEAEEAAVRDAEENAKRNGIENVSFTCINAADFQAEETPDVVVIDPPRKGCDAALLNTLTTVKPFRIVYVSCDPATLARDVRILAGHGYRTDSIRPCDMFPQSVHTECVVSLSRG